MNKSVWAQAQITRARELNLGRGPGSIAIESADVDNLDEILALWA